MKQRLYERVANCDRSAPLKHSSVNPYALTKQGVAMLSAVLRSDVVGQETIQQLRFSNIENTIDLLKQSHDRFLIIDGKELYPIGASLKDLGKEPVMNEVEPWFAFSRMDSLSNAVLNKIKRTEK